MLKRFAYAFGFTTLLLVSNLVQAFHADGVPVYHSQLAPPTVFFAIAGDYIVCMVLAAMLYQFLRKRYAETTIAPVLLALLPGILLLFNRIFAAMLWQKVQLRLGLLHWTDTSTGDVIHPISFSAVVAISVAWAVVVVLISRIPGRGRRACLRMIKIVCLAGILLGANLMVNVVRGAIRRLPDSKMAAMHPSTAEQRATHPRIVWVVMDELSYAPVFETRLPDLPMPNFDKLSAISTVYSHTEPVSYWTDLALPSLLSGQTFTTLEYSYANKLSFIREDQGLHPFDPQQTVFGDAERAGWNVALVGWWNPYCTIFSGMLQRCFWTINDAYSPMRATDSVGKNMLRSVTYRFKRWDSPPFKVMRRKENLTVLSHALNDLQDDQMDMVFVHIGVPHFPYIYDRHTGKFDTVNEHSYQDGLAYADVVLGQLMAAMQSSPRWNQTTFILNGDHSWRTQVWMTSPGWTKEDYETSGEGKFDDRPLMIIHRAGQTEKELVDTPTPLLHTHAVAESVIRSTGASNVN